MKIDNIISKEFLPQRCCFRHGDQNGDAAVVLRHQPIHRLVKRVCRNICFQMDTHLHPAKSIKFQLKSFFWGNFMMFLRK